VKRPFAMVLNNGLKHWRIAGHSLLCDNMLAYIVALGRTSPKQQPVVKGWKV
jgi:hypothetical protein